MGLMAVEVLMNKEISKKGEDGEEKEFSCYPLKKSE